MKNKKLAMCIYSKKKSDDYSLLGAIDEGKGIGEFCKEEFGIECMKCVSNGDSDIYGNVLPKQQPQHTNTISAKKREIVSKNVTPLHQTIINKVDNRLERINCPSCNKQVNVTAHACPSCGLNIASYINDKRREEWELQGLCPYCGGTTRNEKEKKIIPATPPNCYTNGQPESFISRDILRCNNCKIIIKHRWTH
ncbi:MAG: hypothetical protein FWE27_09925 [Defluviitaleaceae bacterium]|nr:hypothetical protein [Defluviitaleaceae bacterium]